MISLTLALIIGACLLSISAWFKWQSYRAESKIAAVEQQNQHLTEQNRQLQAEKTVAQTQIKHHQTRKQNEENARISDRTSVLDRLQQSNDLRD